MLNASQIKGLIPEGGSLILNITATKDSKLSVLVNPQCPEKSTPNLSGAAGAIKAATAPRLITGTPEELDNGFMDILNKVIESRSSLSATLEAIEKETKEAIDKARVEGTKKVEEAQKTAAKTTKPKVVPPASPSAPAGADLALVEKKNAGQEEADAIEEAEKEAGTPVQKEVATQQTFSLF